MAAKYLLGIFASGRMACASEIDPKTTTVDYYTTPSAAKAAGSAFVKEHGCDGFTVARILNHGHYRTVHTEWSALKGAAQ